MSGHVPVMLEASLELLAVRQRRWYVDGTFGRGGHSAALLDRGACVLAIDRDPEAAERARSFAARNFRFVAGNFRDLASIAAEAGASDIAGVLLDLGVSSPQFDSAERGFSFRSDGPLDMRMDPGGTSAAEVVNSASANELAALIYRYGEERHSRRIARSIVEARQQAPIETTARLAEVVAAAYPRGARRDHPARRTFQALRIHVNDELAALAEGLAGAERVLAARGRLVVISFHSLEDRIVKRHFADSDRLESLTRRPLTAGPDEIARNSRARSAKLRAASRRAP